MKILWVKSGGLLPLDSGGKIRSFNLLKELARNHKISLFLFYGSHPNDHHDELRQYFEVVETVPLDLPEKRGIGEAIAYASSVLSPWPYSVSKYCKPEASARLLRLLQSRKFDVLVCDFLFAAKVIPWNWPMPKVLFTHNVEEVIWRRSYEVAKNPVWKAVCWREYSRMKDTEREYVARADQVLTVSENDRAYFASYAEENKISVVQTGVDVDYFQPMAGREQQNRIVFTGSMDWLPNEDAIFYLHEAILPEIRGIVPGVEGWVVGRSPSKKLRDLDRNGGSLRVTGPVDDIRPYIAESSVYVVPLRIGGGTRIKIFEAMAMGKAIVSTSIGAEGLPVEHGKNIVLADSPREFASCVVRLLQNVREREALGAAARALVEQNYSWAAVVRNFNTALERAVNGGNSGSDVYH